MTPLMSDSDWVRWDVALATLLRVHGTPVSDVVLDEEWVHVVYSIDPDTSIEKQWIEIGRIASQIIGMGLERPEEFNEFAIAGVLRGTAEYLVWHADQDWVNRANDVFASPESEGLGTEETVDLMDDLYATLERGSFNAEGMPDVLERVTEATDRGSSAADGYRLIRNQLDQWQE